MLSEHTLRVRSHVKSAPKSTIKLAQNRHQLCRISRGTIADFNSQLIGAKIHTIGADFATDFIVNSGSNFTCEHTLKPVLLRHKAMSLFTSILRQHPSCVQAVFGTALVMGWLAIPDAATGQEWRYMFSLKYGGRCPSTE